MAADLHFFRNKSRADKPVRHDTTLVELDSPGSVNVGIDLDSLKPGSKLATYLIVSKIGEGGMGAVYKAHDTVLDRTVALKILSPQLFRNREYLERFRIEAQAHARLNGPNIVTLHSMFDIPSSLVLVLEYIEGQTLAQRLHNEGHISVAAAVWLFEQTLLGIDRAHRMGVVHRDLKPSNIFITKAREVKLMDFGVAKILNNDGPTQVGSIIGTLRYISPEQINGQDSDFRSDIYSLGISLYEALTGVVPFNKNTEYEYMNAHLYDAPVPPSTLNASIPKELEALILKAIEKDPNKRFQSAREFRNALLTLGIKHVRAYRRIKAQERNLGAAASVQFDLTQPDLAIVDERSGVASFIGRNKWPIASTCAALVAVILGAQFYWDTTEPPAKLAVKTPVVAASPAAPPITLGFSVLEPGVAPVFEPMSPLATRASSASTAPEVVVLTPRPAAVAKPNKPKPPAKYEVLRNAWGQ